MSESIGYLFNRVENIVAKGEISHYIRVPAMCNVVFFFLNVCKSRQFQLPPNVSTYVEGLNDQLSTETLNGLSN